MEQISLPSVKIELTNIGLEKWKQVVRLVFDYLGMLQRLEPNKRYWNELLQRKEIIFNHNEDCLENRAKFYTEVSTKTFLQTATRTGKAINISITTAGVVIGGATGCGEANRGAKVIGKGVTEAINACIKVTK